MKNITEQHANHLELISEITFLKTELNFLRRLLTKEYSTAVNNGKIKIMDGYSTVFDNQMNELATLLKKIEKEEEQMVRLFPNEDLLTSQKKLIENFQRINKAVRILKESFYEFILESHREAK